MEGGFSEDDAGIFVKDYLASVHWSWSSCRPPTLDTVLEHLRRLRNSAPGKVGIPNAAWKALAKFVSQHLLSLVFVFFGGEALPTGFNDGVLVFLPKAIGVMLEAVFLHPLELRPLTLKNSDSEVVAGILSWIIHPVITEFACTIQRGFFKGHRLSQNPLDLDFSARRDALEFSARRKHTLNVMSDLQLARPGLLHLIPAMLLFDFAAAFPSVKHKWL